MEQELLGKRFGRSLQTPPNKAPLTPPPLEEAPLVNITPPTNDA